MTAVGTLTLLPGLSACVRDDKQIVLTRKFVEGVSLYAKLWPGPVKVVMHPEEKLTSDLDHVAYKPGEHPFTVELCRFDSPALADKLVGSALVLGGHDYRAPNLVDWCERLGIPCVYISEYSLRTRLQIVRLSAPNVLRQLRSSLWEINQERLILRGLRRGAGVQCNGTPTYDFYRRFSPNPLLYFDTRTETTMLASADDMAQRATRLRAGGPLTLAFSGRLIPMKGANDIIEVAAQLKRRGFAFRFLIAGDGTSVPTMKERVAREGLTEVEFLGVLPFVTGLMPLMCREVDLFVACHPQGDPSCTYLETLAAGVPIVGYENEAFAGLLRLGEIGWGAPLNQPERVAQLISALSREQILERSYAGLNFARQHVFESTFERRIEHLLKIVEKWQSPRARVDSAAELA